MSTWSFPILVSHSPVLLLPRPSLDLWIFFVRLSRLLPAQEHLAEWVRRGLKYVLCLGWGHIHLEKNIFSNLLFMG